MPTETETYGEVRSSLVYSPFDEGLEILAGLNENLISIPENAQLRIISGPNSRVSRNGNWTREGILYVPRGKPRLVRNSPILFSAKEATEAHGQGREFYPSKDAIEQALVDSVEFPSSNTEISTNGLADNSFTVYALGGEEQARAYGEFLRQAGINNLPVWVVGQDSVNSQDNTFVRQMWFRSLVGRSGLVGDGRDLHYVDGLRGVSRRTSEAGSQDLPGFVKGLTNEEIARILYPTTFALRSQLEVAIMTQDYELAARLRDRINLTDEPLK